MIRKQARQRRDYLYRRALTQRDAETAAKRAALKTSLASGKPLDPSIANDTALRADYKYDETVADRSTADELDLDDEYAALSGVTDPRILVTTAREPSSRLRTFAKEVRLMLPTGVAPNRGNLILAELVRAATQSGFSDVVMLHEHRGTPTALTVSHLPHGPTASFSLHNVLLRRDVSPDHGPVNESYPHVVFEGFSSALGRRVVKVLKHLFPPLDAKARARAPKDGRVITFKNVEDSIEVRHHAFVRSAYNDVALQETGPRMTMRLFEIRGGTLDNKDGDKEWHLSQYTRTAKKKDYLELVVTTPCRVHIGQGRREEDASPEHSLAPGWLVAAQRSRRDAMSRYAMPFHWHIHAAAAAEAAEAAAKDETNKRPKGGTALFVTRS